MKSAQNSQILPKQSVQFKKAISITSNASNKSVDPSQQIADTFAKIHDTIDNLDIKVNLLLQKHEAEFLFAWRSHIKKIKKQLYEIKQRADEKEKQMNSNQRLIALEKQMALFRDQSLRLYQQVEERKGELQIHKRKLKEQQSQLQTLREENKQLIKNIKMAQVKNNLTNQKLQQLEKQLLKYSENNQTSQQLQNSAINKISLYSNFTKDNFIKSQQRKTIGFEATKLFSTQKNTVGLEKLKKYSKQQQPISKDTFHIPSIKLQTMNRLSVTTAKQNKRSQSFYKNSYGTTNKKDLFQEAHLGQRNRLSSMRDPKNRNQLRNEFIMIEPKVYDTELKGWFLECIRAIKKEISSRKIGFSSSTNDIMRVESFEEFKTIDKLRLLEMFLQNQKLLNYMYQKIFPDRMKQIESYLKTQNHQPKDTQTNIKAENFQKQIVNMYSIVTAENQINNQHENKDDDEQQNLQAFLKNTPAKNAKNHQNTQGKLRLKSVSKASKSQPIKNRIVMKDGKLGLMT